jgi:hypothetical protein
MKKKDKVYEIAPGITCYGFKPKGYTKRKIQVFIIRLIMLLIVLSILTAAILFILSKIF